MGSRFWQRYRGSPLLADLADRAAYFTKAVAAIYIVRENLIEFTVVSRTCRRRAHRGSQLRRALVSRAAQRRQPVSEQRAPLPRCGRWSPLRCLAGCPGAAVHRPVHYDRFPFACLLGPPCRTLAVRGPQHDAHLQPARRHRPAGACVGVERPGGGGRRCAGPQHAEPAPHGVQAGAGPGGRHRCEGVGGRARARGLVDSLVWWTACPTAREVQFGYRRAGETCIGGVFWGWELPLRGKATGGRRSITCFDGLCLCSSPFASPCTAVYVPSSTKLGLGRTVMVPRGHVWLQVGCRRQALCWLGCRLVLPLALPLEGLLQPSSFLCPAIAGRQL